jgi:hypothetical protein
MARDVVIRRCVVQVVRHGGWNWNLTRRGLVDRIIGDLPQLITQHLDGLDVPEGDVEMTAPVRIAIRIPTSNLRKPEHTPAHPRDPSSGIWLTTTPLTGRLVDPTQPRAGRTDGERVTSTVGEQAASPNGQATSPHRQAASAKNKQATGKARAKITSDALPRLTPTGRGQTAEHRAGPRGHAARPESAAQRLLRYLARLHSRDELSSLLALLPASALHGWYRILNAAVAPGGPVPGAPPEQAQFSAQATALDEEIAVLLASSDDRALLDPILTLFALIKETRPDIPADAGADRQSHDGTAIAGGLCRYVRRVSSRPPTEGQIRDGLQALAQLAANADPDAANHLSDRAIDTTLNTTPKAAGRRQAGPIDVDIESALPFLLLAPLHQIGYLDAIPAALDAIGLGGSSHLLATGLAYAVPCPAGRGLDRARPDQAIAAFAGLPEPAREPAVISFVGRAGPALAVLNAVLARSLTAGHTPGESLLLTAAPADSRASLVLAEDEGIFPILWADRPDQVIDTWRASSSPLILVGSSAAAPDTLAELAAAGIRFIVAVPPIHQERWRRLVPYRLWTNDETSSAQQLASKALTMPDSIERLDELMSRLASAWSVGPIAADSPLARGMTLAAAVGLGTIAWTLWKDREAPNPLLALERFGDLSAHVRIDADRVQIRLPLGRRSSDLREHGFLTDIAHVPWLPGRVVEFTGG